MNPTTQPPPQPPPLLPPQQQPPPPLQQQQPLQPHRPSTSCDRHPQEHFTGFCPVCLCERLAVLDPNSSSSSARKPPTSSTAAAALKAIFRPSAASRATANRPPPSSSFLPELRRTKSFSASKNEALFGAFEPQRRSCDVRARSTLFSLFNQDDDRKIPKKETEVETHNLASSSVIQRPVNEEDYSIVIEDENDEIRVLEEVEPQLQQHSEPPNVIIEERVQEIVEEEPEIVEEPELEVYAGAEETLKPMKEHMDLDSQAKKSSGRDFKEIAGSFWSAASVFSKKLQKWRQKQKMKKRGRNGAVVGSGTLLPVEKPIGRQFRETQSEIADYGFGRRSCDTDPRFSLDAGRMSFDGDPRYSFDEPRASWDGYLMGRTTFPLPPRMPTMLSVVEDAPVQVLRTDSLIPVEEPLAMTMNAINEHEDETLPGGSAQTREYYSDSSSRRRKSLDRSSSIRKTAAAVVAEMDELKPVINANANANANAKVTPAASSDYFPHLRDSNSNSLRDDCSETIEVGFKDSGSVIGGKCNGERKGSKKSSSRWSKAWSIWGFINRRGGGGGNKDEDEDSRFSRGNGNGNGVERSYSESWQEFRGERNGDVRGGGFNPKMLRSNSSVSWRNAPQGIGIGGFGSGRKSDVQANGHARKGRDEFVLERNRSARYSPNNIDNNGLLKLYLTPARGGWRNGSWKGGRSGQAHSIARSVLRLY